MRPTHLFVTAPNRLSVTLLFLLALLPAACADRAETGTGSPTEDASASGDTSQAPDTAPDGTEDPSDLADASDGSGAEDDTGGDGSGAEVAEDTTSPEDTEPPVPQPWRSQLYPEDWTPADAGSDDRPALEDYSYAGYASGEREPGPPVDAPRFPVGDYGLLTDGSGQPLADADATSAIQAAINAAAAAGGGIVSFAPGRYRVDGRLFVRTGNIVLQGPPDNSAQLRFTKTADMNFAAHLSFGATPRFGADLPLLADAASRDTELLIAPDASVAEGESIAVGMTITDAFIEDHGMTGTWQAFNGTWQPFAWRRVLGRRETTTSDGRPALALRLDVPLREPYLLRDFASVRTVSGLIREAGIEHLAVSNASLWEDAWSGNQTHIIGFYGAEDCWVDGLTSFAPEDATQPENLEPSEVRSSGLLVEMSRRITIRNSHLANAQNRGGGGNGYLFEIRQSNEVLTQDCTARNGRHNFIQNWGFGTSGCVWHRVESRGSAQILSAAFTIPIPAASEFHHSLATANLIDTSLIEDGWQAHNRGTESTGAGLSAWKNVFWNNRGNGFISSRQWSLGYVIGTSPALSLRLAVGETAGAASAPEDWAEGEGSGDTLVPASLFVDQRLRRLGHP